MSHGKTLSFHLAPMEGVIDPLMRELFSGIGGYDLMATEFIRVTQNLLPESQFYKSSPELHNGGKTLQGTPVKIQLLGSDPQLMAENSQRAAELGAPGIDLNFGCPAKSVNRHDGGATLLKDPNRVFNVVKAVRKATPTHIPVSAKVRLGYENKDLHKEIAQAVEDGGAQCLTIHARTKVEGYAPPAHWEYIAEMKATTKNILVVANGDIWTVEDFYRCQKITGCQTFALGRSAMATPHLANYLKSKTPAIKQNESDFCNHRQYILRYLESFINIAHAQMGVVYMLRRLKQWLRIIQITHPWAAAEIFDKIRTLQPTDESKEIVLAVFHQGH